MKTSLRLLAASVACVLGSAAEAQDYRARLPEDEVIYFLLPDRFENGDASNDKGGFRGDRLATGFDPVGSTPDGGTARHAPTRHRKGNA